MKIIKILGIMAALTLSGQIFAYGQDTSPPFDSIICKDGNTNVQVEIKHYRQTYGAGPAFITAIGTNWIGGWNWKAADEGTRLTGYYHLTIKAGQQNGKGTFLLHALYNPFYGDVSGGWLEMSGVSVPVDCEIVN